MKTFKVLAAHEIGRVGCLKIERNLIPQLQDWMIEKVLNQFMEQVGVESNFLIDYIRRYCARNEYAVIGDHLEMEQKGDYTCIYAIKKSPILDVNIFPIDIVE